MRLLICACVFVIVGGSSLEDAPSRTSGVRHRDAQEAGSDGVHLARGKIRRRRNESSLHLDLVPVGDQPRHHMMIVSRSDDAAATPTPREKRRRKLTPEQKRRRKLRRQARREQGLEERPRRNKKRHGKEKKHKNRKKLVGVQHEEEVLQNNVIPSIKVSDAEDRIPDNYFQHLAEWNKKLGKGKGEEEQDNDVLSSSKGVGSVETADIEDNNLLLARDVCAAARCEQVCSDVQGRAVCSCYRGFRLRGSKCWDMNECARQNGGCQHGCRNSQGSFHCFCRQGFRLEEDGFTCRDVNECLLRNGHGPCQDTCRNTWSGYVCTCAGLPGTRLAKDGHTCEDLNECTRADNGGCSHTCLNTLGTAFCLCPAGFKLSPDYKTCLDIDECHDSSGQYAQCSQRCLNTPGSYSCHSHCTAGYQSDEHGECRDLDECDGVNDCSQLCINTRGSYHCACNLGYVLLDDKVTCQEVGQNAAVCPPLDTPTHGYLECSRLTLRANDWRYRIVNHSGSYCELRCPKGYTLDGVYRRFCGQSGRWLGPNYGVCKRHLFH